MRLIIKFLLTGLAAYLAAKILPGVEITGFGSAIILAVVLALLNLIVRPILVLFTIPITFLTLGLFLLVINTIIILIADSLVDGFETSGFIAAFFFSIVMSLIGAVIDLVR